MTATPAGVVHFAGLDVQIGPLLRQRCAWCGVILVDYDLTRVAVPEGQEGGPATWPVSTLVLRDGNLSAQVPHEDGTPLPDNTCDRLPPETDHALFLKVLGANAPNEFVSGRVVDNLRVAIDPYYKFTSDVVMFRITGDLVRET